MTIKEFAEALAKKFESHARWEAPGYYTEGVDRDIAYAKKDIFESLATEFRALANEVEG